MVKPNWAILIQSWASFGTQLKRAKTTGMHAIALDSLALDSYVKFTQLRPGTARFIKENQTRSNSALTI